MLSVGFGSIDMGALTYLTKAKENDLSAAVPDTYRQLPKVLGFAPVSAGGAID
jgi:hypothetical protein